MRRVTHLSFINALIIVFLGESLLLYKELEQFYDHWQSSRIGRRRCLARGFDLNPPSYLRREESKHVPKEICLHNGRSQSEQDKRKT